MSFDRNQIEFRHFYTKRVSLKTHKEQAYFLWWNSLTFFQWTDMVDLRGKPPYLPPTHNYTEVMKMAIEKAFKYYGVDPNTHVDPALLSGKIVIIWLTQCTVFLTHILESQAFAYINQKYVPWNNEVYFFYNFRTWNEQKTHAQVPTPRPTTGPPHSGSRKCCSWSSGGADNYRPPHVRPAHSSTKDIHHQPAKRYSPPGNNSCESYDSSRKTILVLEVPKWISNMYYIKYLILGCNPVRANHLDATSSANHWKRWKKCGEHCCSRRGRIWWGDIQCSIHWSSWQRRWRSRRR